MGLDRRIGWYGTDKLWNGVGADGTRLVVQHCYHVVQEAIPLQSEEHPRPVRMHIAPIDSTDGGTSAAFILKRSKVSHPHQQTARTAHRFHIERRVVERRVVERRVAERQVVERRMVERRVVERRVVVDFHCVSSSTFTSAAFVVPDSASTSAFAVPASTTASATFAVPVSASAYANCAVLASATASTSFAVPASRNLCYTHFRFRITPSIPCLVPHNPNAEVMHCRRIPIYPVGIALPEALTGHKAAVRRDHREATQVSRQHSIE